MLSFERSDSDVHQCDLLCVCLCCVEVYIDVDDDEEDDLDWPSEGLWYTS